MLGMYECVCLFSSPHASFFLTSSLSFYPSLSCIYPLSSPIYLSHVSLCPSLPLLTSSPLFSLSFARYRSRLLRRHGRSSPCSSHISSQSTRGPIEVYIYLQADIDTDSVPAAGSVHTSGAHTHYSWVIIPFIG